MRKKQKRELLATEEGARCLRMAIVVKIDIRRMLLCTPGVVLFLYDFCADSAQPSKMPLSLDVSLILLRETQLPAFSPFGFFTGRVRSLLILRWNSRNTLGSVRFATQQKGLSASAYRAHNVDFGMQRVPTHFVCAAERCLQPRPGEANMFKVSAYTVFRFALLFGISAAYFLFFA